MRCPGLKVGVIWIEVLCRSTAQSGGNASLVTKCTLTCLISSVCALRTCRSQATALLDPVALQVVAAKHSEVREGSIQNREALLQTAADGSEETKLDWSYHALPEGACAGALLRSEAARGASVAHHRHTGMSMDVSALLMEGPRWPIISSRFVWVWVCLWGELMQKLCAPPRNSIEVDMHGSTGLISKKVPSGMQDHYLLVGSSLLPGDNSRISSEGGRLGSQPSTRAPWKLEAGSLESKDLEEV
eukprot:1158000-Pelagomonas_calceolata.AAC.3